MFNLNPIGKSVQHRVELLDEIESTTKKLSDDLKPETIQFLKEKLNELEETNKELEQKKEEYKSQKKHCQCTRIKGLHWTIFSLFSCCLILYIARMVLIYGNHSTSINQNNSTSSTTSDGIIIGDVLETLLLVFGGLTVVQQAWLSADDNNLRALNDVSLIEKYGEESYKRFLQALEELPAKQNKDQVRQCIHTFDEIPESAISRPLKREKLIPQLLEILPEDDEIVIKLNQLKEDGRRIHIEVSSIEPNRFDGEKTPFTTISHPGLPPPHHYRNLWSELERELDTQFDSLEFNDAIFCKNGTVEQLATMIPIPLEEEIILENPVKRDKGLQDSDSEGKTIDCHITNPVRDNRSFIPYGSEDCEPLSHLTGFSRIIDL